MFKAAEQNEAYREDPEAGKTHSLPAISLHQPIGLRFEIQERSEAWQGARIRGELGYVAYATQRDQRYPLALMLKHQGLNLECQRRAAQIGPGQERAGSGGLYIAQERFEQPWAKR